MPIRPSTRSRGGETTERRSSAPTRVVSEGEDAPHGVETNAPAPTLDLLSGSGSMQSSDRRPPSRPASGRNAQLRFARKSSFQYVSLSLSPREPNGPLSLSYPPATIGRK